MRACVTGANGFIGANLVRALLKKGARVRAMVRQSSDVRLLKGLDVEIAFGDLRDKISLKKAFQDCEVLYHTAALYAFWMKDPACFYDVNVEGTRNVLEVAGEAGVSKIVYTSTVGTIRSPKNPNTPSDENSFAEEGEMETDYKRSKFLAEQVALDFAKKGLPVVIVNPSAPIGSYDGKPTPTGRIIIDFLQRSLPLYINTGLNIVDVEDVAVGHILAGEKGKIGERYILGNKNISLKEIYAIVGEQARRKSPSLRIPYGLAYLAALGSEGVAYWKKTPPAVSLGAVQMARRYMYFSPAKAVRELGLPQSPIERAFEKAVSWFRDNGYLNGFFT